MAKPDSIRPVQDSTKVCFMLYGPPGSGKTRLIGENPSTLILRPPTDHTDSIRTVGADEWVLNDWADMGEAHEYCRHNPTDYNWVWFDSISLFQDSGLDDIWDGVVAAKPHRAEYGVDKGEYGRNMWRLGQWVRHMVGIQGFNFGITAHPAELEHPITGKLKFQPWIQGKNMSTKIQGYMNIVAYLEVVEQDGAERRVLRTAGTHAYEAKDQFDLFPNGRLVDPTMAKITSALKTARPEANKVTPMKKRRVGAAKKTTAARSS